MVGSSLTSRNGQQHDPLKLINLNLRDKISRILLTRQSPIQ